MTEFGFRFDNSYAQELEGFYIPWQGEKVPAPKIIQLNRKLAVQLGLNPVALDGAADILSGAAVPDGAQPLAQAYAGHQFGGFSPQLGDGRALLIGEILDRNENRFDIHLKGSGRTPFSRGGDGKAVLGPVLREYLMGEAMYALGVPTTRALAAVTTGETIMRDGPKPGAVLARVASSHLRVGTFQFFAARGEVEKVRKLADYAIWRHYPALQDHPEKYLHLLRAVTGKQAELIAKWMHVGFVHGVMNTDNTTISGETIDYGPCAFMDTYDPSTVFSSIDHNGRYAFGNQPVIAQWNLARLAEALIPLINPDQDKAVELATTELDQFSATYSTVWLRGMRAKTGLCSEQSEDAELMTEMLAALEGQDVDYTSFFRALPRVSTEDADVLLSLFNDGQAIKAWLSKWRIRLALEKVSAKERTVRMNSVNPVFIPRNHLVEEALSAAQKQDFTPFKSLLDVLSDPFTERNGLEKYTHPAPADFGQYQTYCGT